MESTLTLAFQSRLRYLLPGSPDLQLEVRSRLWATLDLSTRVILSFAAPAFFHIPPTGKTVFCLHFFGAAIIAQAPNWDRLDTLCRQLHALTGITEVYIRGSDICCRCRLENGQWIRETLGEVK